MITNARLNECPDTVARAAATEVPYLAGKRRGLAQAILPALDGLTGAQVVGIGVGTAHLVPNASGRLGSSAVLGIAAVAAVTAVAIRLASSSDGVSLGETSAVSKVGAAGVTVTCAILCVGLGQLLLAPFLLYTSKFALWIGLWALLSGACAALLRKLASHPSARALCQRRIFLIGRRSNVDPLKAALSGMSGAWCNLTSHVDSDEPGSVEAILSQPISHNDVVLLIAEPLESARIQDICERLADFPGRVCLALRAPSVGPIPRGLARVGGHVVVNLVADPQTGLPGAVKRLIDIIGAGLLLVLLAPLLIGVSVILRLESRGPVLFRQRRFGIGSRFFELLKFRTMYADKADATGAVATLARDPRVTPFGRFLRRTSIDELPQLLNVLRGDMSLVGPRPHPIFMQVEGSYYFDAVRSYRARHRVKPGITGWAQVNGSRGLVDTLPKAQRRVEFDLWYIEHWSLLLDLKIMFKTLPALISLHAD